MGSVLRAGSFDRPKREFFESAVCMESMCGGRTRLSWRLDERTAVLTIRKGPGESIPGHDQRTGWILRDFGLGRNQLLVRETVVCVCIYI